MGFSSPSTSAGFPVLKDSYLSSFSFPRSSFLESWTENLFLFLWIHVFSRRRVSFHTSPRENWPFRRPMFAISNMSCAVALGLTYGCSSAKSKLFKVSFTKRELLLTNFLFEVPDHHLVGVGWSRDSLF